MGSVSELVYVISSKYSQVRRDKYCRFFLIVVGLWALEGTVPLFV